MMNWVDFIVSTIFMAVCILGGIASMVALIRIYRLYRKSNDSQLALSAGARELWRLNNRIELSWGKLFEKKQGPLKQNSLQLIVSSLFILVIVIYVLFGRGWLFNYLDNAKVFFG